MGENRKNRVTVNIYGEPYTIVGDESKSHVRKVANMVDDQIREIKDQNPYLDTKQLAVLTSVNIVSDYLKLKERVEELEEKNRKEEE
ncbi:MAG TPA: cell division protein ZapA [Bacillales bacterium]|nr:cell division protein ZapA [Bacillales bacterium]